MGKCVLLLNANGVNNGSVFTDSSTYARTVTRLSTATFTSTSQKKFGTASIYNAAGLYFEDSSETHLADLDWTMELWFRSASFASNFTFISQRDNGSSNYSFNWRYETTGPKLHFYWSTNGTSVTDTASDAISPSPSTNTWYHVAACREGADLRMYFNGTRVYTGSPFSTSAFYDSTARPYLLCQKFDTTYQSSLAGYVDDIRIVTGTALYTGETIDVPTADLGNLEGVRPPGFFVPQVLTRGAIYTNHIYRQGI